jgi:hypothetical protein
LMACIIYEAMEEALHEVCMRPLTDSPRPHTTLAMLLSHMFHVCIAFQADALRVLETQQ